MFRCVSNKLRKVGLLVYLKGFFDSLSAGLQTGFREVNFAATKSETVVTWYVLQHKPNQGDRAVEHLQNQEVPCFYPKIEVEQVKDGRRVKRLEPLFPGYIFFRMEFSDPQWAKLRSTRGVLRVVGFNGKPAPVGDDVIAQIKDGMQAIAEQGGMETGQPMEIQEGPFKGFNAIFQTYDGDTRAIVLLEFLQKQQRVRVPVSAIKR